MANPVDENAVPLEDLPLAERQAMRHDHPMLDAYAAKVNAANGLPAHFLTALKNAGERSQSVGANSVSPKGAQGVMQFMPNTAKQYGLDDRTDPIASIDAAGRMGADLMKRLKTDRPDLLAAGYNGGPNRESLRNGQIPDIKETQDYAKRVSAFIDAQPKPVAAKENNTVPFSDLPPEEQAKQYAWEHSSKNPNYYPPTGDFVDNALAGVGKAVSDTGKGLGQLSIGGINGIAHLFGKGDVINKNSVTSTDESNRLDKALMDTGGGMVGNVAGDLAMTALPFGALTKLGMVNKAANLAAKVPVAGGALSAMLPATVAGSVIGAAQPVEDGQGLGARALNGGVGAAMGPIGYALGALGRSAVKAISPITDKISRVTSPVTEYVDLTKPSITLSQTPTGKAAVQAAMTNGVHVYPQQIKAPGTALSPEQHVAQARSFTRAVARNDLGQNTSDLNEALQKASQRATADYKTVYHGETIPVHESVPALRALQENAAKDLDPRFTLPRSDAANALLSKAIASAESKPVLTGDEMQKVLSKYKGEIRDFQKGDKNGFVDRSAIDTLHGIMGTLTGESEKVLSPDKIKLLTETNGRYRRMLELEPTLQNNALGNLSPETYANVIQKKYPKEFVFGKGNQARSDLARFGSTYMTEKPAQKAVMSPTDVALASKALLPTLGAIGGGNLSSDHTGLGTPGNIGGGALGGALLSAALGSRTPSTNRVLARELEKHGGALSRVFTNGRTPNAIGNMVNSKGAADDSR